jgi:hypothetical protein
MNGRKDRRIEDTQTDIHQYLSLSLSVCLYVSLSLSLSLFRPSCE